MGRLSKVCKCLLLIIALIILIFLVWSFLVWAGVLPALAGSAGGWTGAMATAGAGIASNLGWVAGAATLGAYALSPGTFKDGVNQIADDVGDLAKKILLSPLLWLGVGAFALFTLFKSTDDDDRRDSASAVESEANRRTDQESDANKSQPVTDTSVAGDRRREGDSNGGSGEETPLY